MYCQLNKLVYVWFHSWLVITFGDESFRSKIRPGMATYGKVGEFKESEESWTQYVERLEQHFLANDVEDMAKRRAILLSIFGSKTYALARDLLQLARPAETTFKKIVDTLEKHFSPKPSEIVERYKFHSRNGNDGEGVAAYVAELLS